MPLRRAAMVLRQVPMRLRHRTIHMLPAQARTVPRQQCSQLLCRLRKTFRHHFLTTIFRSKKLFKILSFEIFGEKFKQFLSDSESDKPVTDLLLGVRDLFAAGSSTKMAFLVEKSAVDDGLSTKTAHLVENM